MTSAQFLVFAAWTDFFVARLEDHSLVDALAHSDGDALVVLVEHLTGRTSTALDALQSERRAFSFVPKSPPADGVDGGGKNFN